MDANKSNAPSNATMTPTFNEPTTSINEAEADRPMTPKSCIWCGNEDTEICKGCQDARYCSKQCQKKDWPVHKLVCSKFAAARDSPGDNYYRCLYFPTDGSGPNFVWLHFETVLAWSPEAKALLDNVNFAGSGATMDTGLGRELGYNLNICYRSAFLGDGSLTNKSIAKLAGVMNSDRFRGPFLVLGHVDDFDIDGEGSLNKNLDTRALRPLVELFNDFVGGRSFEEQLFRAKSLRK